MNYFHTSSTVRIFIGQKSARGHLVLCNIGAVSEIAGTTNARTTQCFGLVYHATYFCHREGSTAVLLCGDTGCQNAGKLRKLRKLDVSTAHLSNTIMIPPSAFSFS